MFVYSTKQLTLLNFFLASSFYPGRGDPLPASTTPLEHNQHNVLGGESDVEDVESVRDWLDDPDLDADEAAPRRTSRFQESITIEVCFQFLFGSKLIL